MTVANYSIGPPKRPNIHHDNGFLDYFPRRKPGIEDYREYAKWIGILEAGEAGQGVPLIPHNDIPDGLAAYRHFLFGKGSNRVFSYERYVANDPSGSLTLSNATKDAQQGAELLYMQNFSGQTPVHFQMTGSAIRAGSKNPAFPYPRTENWQKAIGAHIIWISAEVDVVIQNHMPQFNMIMTLHAEDRFNFNPGAKDINTGIPDSANGIFEITGLANQYMNYSTLQRTVKWTGSVTGSLSSDRSKTGRDRQPSDNRRIRNKL
jgi:hypothetical protein